MQVTPVESAQLAALFHQCIDLFIQWNRAAYCSMFTELVSCSLLGRLLAYPASMLQHATMLSCVMQMKPVVSAHLQDCAWSSSYQSMTPLSTACGGTAIHIAVCR